MELMDFRRAQQLVLQQARSFGKETVPLEQALGRVLGETVRADRDYPPFDRASMDGFAVRFSDLESGIRRFRIIQTLLAGSVATRPMAAGECYKIMTGAAAPAGATVVIQRENAVEEGNMMVLSDVPDPAGSPFPWRIFQNIARRGEDLAAGSVVIDGPCLCEPPVIGLLASLGKVTVTVERLPAIAVLTTGDEVVAADGPVSEVQIRNSNRWLLEAALKKMGVGVRSSRHVPDDPALLRREIEAGLASDVLILCGGVSAGDADYVPGALASAGVQKLFHKVAIRPGKPVWCGVAPGGPMVFALPGNPFSCLVNAVLLIRPFLQACYGLPPAEPLGLGLAVARKKRSPLDEFFPVHVEGSPARVTPVPLNGSGDIRLGRQANMLALHPAGAGDLPEGAVVPCYSFV